MAIFSKIYSFTKFMALSLGCAYLSLSVGAMLLSFLPGTYVSSHQVEPGLKPLTQSKHVSAEASVVRLYHKDEFFCSGIVVGGNYLLTAAHCLVDENGVMKKDEIRVESNDKTVSVVGEPAGVNTRMDWGLVTGDFTRISSAILLSDGLEITQKVVSCGYPHGSTTLYCAPLMPLMNDGFEVKCRGMVFPGMSGGPVFDENGVVIGLNTLAYPLQDGGGSAYTPTISILANFGIGPN